MLELLQEKLDALESFAHDHWGYSSEDHPENANPGIGRTENMLAFTVAIAATFLARNALQASWKATLGEAPPKNPSSSDVDWKDALLWGAVSGALVGVTRIVSRRASSSVYRNFRYNNHTDSISS